MAIRDIFKVSWKTFLNPASWIDAQTLKEQNVTILSVLKSLFSQPVPERTETFEQACKRMGLSEADLQASASSYRSYALLFFVLGLTIFLYSFYLLFTLELIGFILGIAVSGLFFAFAFKYDFWVFQIRQRRLGATFAEWKQSILGDKKGGSS